MNKILLISLIVFIIAETDYYKELISAPISQKECEDIIGNMSSIIEEAYIYSDFLKAPVQPEGHENYIPKVDLIKELKDINTTNRTFYFFFRDIKNVLKKTRDGHFKFLYSNYTSYSHCLPFTYEVLEDFDENDKAYNASLTIEPRDECTEIFDDETLEKIEELSGKKIIKINGVNPYEYFDKMELNSQGTCHSPQCRYINMMRHENSLEVSLFL